MPAPPNSHQLRDTARPIDGPRRLAESLLEQHFSARRARRSAEVGDRPIFALEHGLDEQEVGELAAAVRVHIVNGPAQWEHRLPWVVYAAELGYLYSGDEYWQTFEQRTPGWLLHGDRHWIRRCFHSRA